MFIAAITLVRLHLLREASRLMDAERSIVDQVVAIDFALDYPIEATGLRAPIAFRRLNALENTIAALACRWRPNSHTPIAPAHKLRMDEATCLRWLQWVDAEQTGDPRTVARLTTYAARALTDPSVPTGWIRLLLSP